MARVIIDRNVLSRSRAEGGGDVQEVTVLRAIAGDKDKSWDKDSDNNKDWDGDKDKDESRRMKLY